MNHHSAYYLGVKQVSNAGFLSQRAIDVEPGPNLVICLCQDRSQINFCTTTTVDCFSSQDQDAICVPACQSHKGLLATGCLINDPSCTGQ
jgi:hypothetical protein